MSGRKKYIVTILGLNRFIIAISGHMSLWLFNNLNTENFTFCVRIG